MVFPDKDSAARWQAPLTCQRESPCSSKELEIRVIAMRDPAKKRVVAIELKLQMHRIRLPQKHDQHRLRSVLLFLNEHRQHTQDRDVAGRTPEV